jgi:hypothetical protein
LAGVAASALATGAGAGAALASARGLARERRGVTSRKKQMSRVTVGGRSETMIDAVVLGTDSSNVD